MKLIDILNDVLRYGHINEAGLSRLIGRLDGRVFAIVSAHRHENTKQENDRLTDEMLATLNNKRMGGYKLIGYWLETPDGIEYSPDISKEQLVEVIEEPVLFVMPDTMSQDEFINIAVQLANKYKQESVIVGLPKITRPTKNPDPLSRVGKDDDQLVHDMEVYLIDRQGDRVLIGTKMTLGKIAQAYSRMRNKPNIPFVFEGILQPGSNSGRHLFKVKNILYER